MLEVIFLMFIFYPKSFTASVIKLHSNLFTFIIINKLIQYFMRTKFSIAKNVKLKLIILENKEE